MHKTSLISLIIVIATACSTPTPYPSNVVLQTAMPLWNNPIFKPKYIDAVEIYSSQTAFSPARMCLDFDSYGMWQPGDYGPDTYSRLQRTIQFDIDGVPQTNLEVIDMLNSLDMFDANHNVIGSLGGPYAACVEISKLPDGMHVAAINFQNRAGNTLEYSWAFKSSKLDNKITLQLPTTP